mgnify:CR=1 FL=1
MIDSGKKEDEALDLLDGATALPVVPEVGCREYLIFGGQDGLIPEGGYPRIG